MRPRAFTLIELLVTISIISLLSSIVLASITAAREKARLGAAHQQDAVFQHSIGDQLVGWWPLDDCSGVVAKNVVDSRYPGALIQSPGIGFPQWNATDKPFTSGCSISFVPTSAVDLDTSTAPDYLPAPQTVHTYTLWFKDTGSTGTYQALVSKEGSCVGFELNLTPTGVIQGTHYYNGNCANYTLVRSTKVYTGDSKWHFVAFTVDRIAGKLWLYVDGEPAGTAPADTSASYAANALRIGLNNSSTYSFAGLMDDVRVYSSALTLASIQDLYHTGLAIHLARE